MSQAAETSTDVRMTAQQTAQEVERKRREEEALDHGYDVRDLPNAPVDYTPSVPHRGDQCPWPEEDVKACYTKVAPLVLMTPHRSRGAKSAAYHPTASDLVAYVDVGEEYFKAHPEEGMPARDRYLYSFLTNTVIDTRQYVEPPVEVFADSTLRYIQDAIGGDPAKHRVSIGTLAQEGMDVRDRLSSIYTHLSVRDPDCRGRVNFSGHLSTAILGLRPHKAFWGKRKTATLWLDPGASMVYTTHPRNPTIIMATDSGDALIQSYYECRGLLVTGV